MRFLSTLAAALLAAPAALPAQASTTALADRPPHVSDRVLLRLHEPGGAACETSVVGVRGDTLLLNERRPCPARAPLPARPAELFVVGRDHGSRGVHVFVGALLGAAVGGAVLGHPLVVRYTLPGGATLGAIFGAALPAGTRWVRVPAPPPVNVLDPGGGRR